METLESSSGGDRGFGPVRTLPRQTPSPKTKRRTAATERRAIWAIAVAAGVTAALSPATPASLAAANVILRAGFAMLVTLSASRARRWTWLVLGGVAVLGAEGVWLVVAGVALAVALAAAILSRQRIYGAIVAALAVQALLRFPDLGAPMASVAVAAAAVGPVLASAYLVSPRRVRRQLRQALAATVGVFVLAAVAFGISVALAYSAANRGSEDAREGLDAARQGKSQRAAELLDSSARQFSEANGWLTAWWATPVLAVPLVAPNAEALRESTSQGERVAASSAGLARQVDYESLRYRSGQIDLARVRAAIGPLADTAACLASATDSVGRVRSPWLVPMVSDELDRFHSDLTKASTEADLAAAFAKVTPGLLGGDGTRRYFVAVITPSEERGLGGFMGNWLEITAESGRLEITRSGRARDLNEHPGASERNAITADADYAKRYSRFRPGSFFQDVTFSPDLPSVARVLNELYPKAGGAPIDGMISIDPSGLAALLELTGPITITGLDTQLNAANAVEWLTRRQYIDYPNRDLREDFLDEAGRKVFDKLVRGDLPGPRRVADVLAPVIDKHRVMFTSLHADEQSLMDRVEVSGAFPQVTGSDFFSLRSQDRTNSKIDMFSERKVDYRARYDPANGSLDATVTITLDNKAPSAGLPDSIIGSNDRGLPKGTNEMNVSFYTPHRLKEAKVDGKLVGLDFQRELGYSVYSTLVSIPAGGRVTLTLDLEGKLTSSPSYKLTVAPQPMVNPDRFVVTVNSTVDFRLSAVPGSGSGFSVQAGNTEAVLSSTDQRTIRASVALAAR